MRELIICLLFLTSFNAQAQNFGIPIKDHPFFKIIEWKGKGGLLMSRSPKEILNQISFTLVSDEDEGTWDQKLNPKVREPFYLFNEGARHVYFLNNLDLIDNGRVSFNQMSSGGNIKSKILDVGIKVKRLEGDYDYNKFEFINAAVTEKALVYHYRYYHKKEKEYHELAVFMTHHNLSHTVFELGYADYKDVENGINGQWKYAGFEGETIYFAWRGIKTDVHGWTVKGYSPKGEMQEDHFLIRPNNLKMFLNIGYGNTGKYYINDEDHHSMETGLVSYINGNFFLTAIQERNGGSVLVLFERDDDDWIELNSTPLDPIDEKQDIIRLGTFPVNEGITYHYKHNGTDKVGILLFEKGKEGQQENFSEEIVYNPSRLLLDNKENEFVTKVVNGVLVCDLKQFEGSGGIGFQRR